MAKKTKSEDGPQVIDIASIATRELDVTVLGTSPLLLNRLSEKARHELLLPSPPKNRAEKASRLKHVPLEEYRASVYRDPDDEAPTRLVLPGGAFRKAMASAALDIPGSSKSQIGRLVRVVQTNVHVYGVPKLSSMIARMADMRRTPDVRTRAILPTWCTHLTIRYAHPLITERTVMTLLQAAGDFIGIADGRNEKGSSLSFGCFTVTDIAPDDSRIVHLMATGGLKAQDAAIENPEPYDSETAELLSWFNEELVRRDRQPEAKPKATSRRPKITVSDVEEEENHEAT